ncbi:MAG TPA: electron transfer flavoprotein-ubiquinone oxidoreductase [Accumulibacter sp.]|uniref:electron transfer flavoprotein-ubiquinone oxidoreductase n=3 Tax=Accumulibacter sp. TaxID=2053492 RepID=UPI00287A0576|nr:electron transfer flavoprotein-ubiquinone oxidoreductase [Accumulibacter sp.]MDS4054917.1 electron transfer flavoprotein-ubiquinone oxidoreductase [Accumulibacter sp.]HMV06587.1 electron transfer flavoprotein-ubiquinone oxidoreductase [Accumulibacter sp.]HMW64757.1 electron transfer flavoprotein-ubiquinone oxidoreductase [Accumulibacter sp.]HMX69595.1 electron transfer flavoprotein-ubiquinone oxidoreductase [Accumulibacter sp.]HNB67633.1 electron transfer flavoprotein-ubiquinone oxidoreduct
MEREAMEYDVVVVGAGPAGLSAAIRLKQLNPELGVMVLEKGSEVGAHILSGAVMESRALDELLPDWQAQGAPLGVQVNEDQVYLYRSQTSAVRLPAFAVPAPMHNLGNYIVSLGSLCRWLAEQAEALGVEIFPGFAAAEILYHDDGAVKGVATGDMGRDKRGEAKDSFQPGLELHAKYTLFAEGARGQLGKELIARYDLSAGRTAQHYGIGIKELWQIDPAKHRAGLVVHGAGWPLSEHGATGGSFLYHMADNQVAVGLIVDLNYADPYLSPFEEFQRFKTQSGIKAYLEGGKRLCYGARAITKGGLNSLPKQTFAGGLLLGCDAGTLNFAKIKGIHTAMKSGMLAAETVHAALQAGDQGRSELVAYSDALQSSWLYNELYSARNFGPALHKFGTFLGGAFNWIQMNLFGGKMFFTLKDETDDHSQLARAADRQPITYPKPDGQITFDRLSSVFMSNAAHEEDQPVHLQLLDPQKAIVINFREYASPEQRYCPAGVYEIVEEASGPRLQINASNCVHCKTCDIKDPTQNIRWVAPEGGGGPNYPNM